MGHYFFKISFTAGIDEFLVLGHDLRTVKMPPKFKRDYDNSSNIERVSMKLGINGKYFIMTLSRSIFLYEMNADTRFKITNSIISTKPAFTRGVICTVGIL